MIHIERTPPPPELTQEVVAQKVAEFKLTKNPVWNEPYIKNALLGMSHNKCCYCECELNVEGSYMEVEHFRDKKQYPDEVVSWDNLLPSCKRCNGHKSSRDTVAVPIVNPASDCPQDHMLLKQCVRFRAKDTIGQNTIDVLFLNDQDKLVLPRFKVNQALNEKLEEFCELAQCLVSGDKTGTHPNKKLQNGMIALLQDCQPDKAYSAVKVTTVLTDDCYCKIKQSMVQLDLWTEEMDSLEAAMSPCKYEAA